MALKSDSLETAVWDRRDMKSAQDLENKIKRLNIENALLQQEILKMEGNPVYQEMVAREKMGVVRKGEIPIKIVPQKQKN